jgi:ectonucleoside triphosphate diphosphohydrolase 5/6
MTNNELRRRKHRDQNGRPAPNKKRKEIKPSTIHRSFFCLIISGTILTMFILLYIDNIPWHLGHKAVDNIAKKLGYHKPVHAVVIDAGSTGSRVLAFTFHESYIGRFESRFRGILIVCFRGPFSLR